MSRVGRLLRGAGTGPNPAVIPHTGYWTVDSLRGTADTTLVSSLPGKGGTLTGVGAARPTYSKTGGGGRGELVFAGSQELIGPTTLITGSGPFAGWVICKTSSTASLRIAFSQGNAGLTTGFSLGVNAATPHLWSLLYEGVATNTDGQAIDDVMTLVGFQRLGGGPADLTEFFTKIGNGAFIQQIIPAPNALYVSTTGVPRLGRRGNGASGWLGSIVAGQLLEGGIWTPGQWNLIAAYQELFL